MKKLMMIMMMVATASMLQAAALTWGGWGYAGTDPEVFTDDVWFTGGQAYLVLVSNAGTFNIENTDSGWTITGGSIIDSIGIVEGSFSKGLNGAEGIFTAGVSYEFAIIFTTEGGVWNGNMADLPATGLWGYSPTSSVVWQAQGATWSMADFNDGWGIQASTTVVPEPLTVGLALAGIALLIAQRKRK